ncbi:MAG: phytanoyl-CoA dioxygenase family protein [Gemmataceae bacterium]|nr:phytanoyl-CoA dioxygenase family protein [Gemmataceae bacterium]
MNAKTTFKAIPSPEELASLNRDLGFHPVANPSPKVLSTQQIEQFNREGYLKPIRIFDAVEAASLRGYFDGLLAKILAEGGTSYSISTAHAKYARIYDVLTHPRIVSYVADLLGENVIAWGSHFFCKMPRDGKTVSWHQDASYWPLTPARAVTVWLAIDDADRGNACMKFIPGSHHYGHLTYKMSEESESNILDQTVENAEGIGQPVYDELLAGECSIHSDLMLHGSGANISDRRRCGLTLRFCSAEVVASLGWYEKGIGVRGKAAPGTWANRERPAE